ncbi:RNA polymerase sigma factor [Actinosynnema sp. NPDC023587]|uniref:RNA polymerase sigma factor n=1 Tax=Actinosynnema sp. NPDC023587 TaxID=3154695 RepID=UPI00340634A3
MTGSGAVARGHYSAASDDGLMALVRAGTAQAFSPLYERHVAVARARARHLVPRCAAEADEVVAEGFLRVLEVLLAGGGPTRSFRAYLLTTITRTALARKRREAQELLTGDPAADEAAHTRVDPRPYQERAVEGALERSLAIRAFERLPASARQVLLYTEVLGMSPAHAAPLLDISPNAVSSRAHRAREALRAAYLDAHVTPRPFPPGCAPVVGELGTWARRALRPRRRSIVDEHLGRCRGCRDLADELASLNTIRVPETPPRLRPTG